MSHRLLGPLGRPTGSGAPAPVARVVVFPHAGGSPRFYSHVGTAVAAARPGVEVLGVTYPGRDHLLGVPTPATLGDLAAAVADDLLTRSDAPLVLHGHSLGALIAHATAATLTAFGRHVVLVVSGRDAPGPVARPGAGFHRRPDDELVGELGRLDPHNAEVFAHPELRELLLPAVRADYRLAETHALAPTTPRIGEIVVVQGREDAEVSTAGLAAWAGLAEVCPAPVVVPGGHFHPAAPDRHLADVLISRLPSHHCVEGL